MHMLQTMIDKDTLKKLRAIKGQLDEPQRARDVIECVQQLQQTSSLAKAGFWLRQARFEQWLACDSSFKSSRIAIIGSGTCNEIENYLRPLCLRSQIFPEILIGEYNQYLFDLLNENSSLAEFDADLTCCLIDEFAILNLLPKAWTLADFKQVLSSFLQTYTQALSRYSQHKQSAIAINTLVLSAQTYQTFTDFDSRAQLSKLLANFNTQLIEFTESLATCSVLDTATLLQSDDVALVEQRKSVFAKMHFSDALLAAFAGQLRRVLQASVGKQKKCLILDCDNTLWGGIIGDDGINGITLGSSPEGEAFVQFQKVIKQLGKQGVILALNSKNEQANTDLVFSQHPDAVLALDDFAIQMVNWNPKHENIKAICKHLNIATEHCVFVDDSAFECDMVRNFLPEVMTLQLSDSPELYVDELLFNGWFDTLKLTEEDYSRGEKYRVEALRSSFQDNYQSVDDYLHSLEIEVETFYADSFSIPRIAQITQRTNQFNLTTERFTEAQVTELCQDPNWLVIGFNVADKFGSSGTCGAVFVEKVFKQNKIELHVRNFLMSCRVFSRGVETAVLNEIKYYAGLADASRIVGYFQASNKNTKVGSFYLDHGFSEQTDSSDQQAFEYHLDKQRDTTRSVSTSVGWININHLEKALEKEYV
ncbi:MAG: FkbH-like protein [Arenicella sp.]|jgi:FkbH-like protein